METSEGWLSSEVLRVTHSLEMEERFEVGECEGSETNLREC